MKELAAKYSAAQVEDKWYKYWLDHKFFHSEPNEKQPYTIVIPPPNVTGILHMGHVLNNTLNDVLIRKARMDGKNACWVPGTDHASIATESKVVAKLKAQGIKKEDIGREEFLRHAWEWKEEHGGIILEQLRKLGCSCDWDRTRFTMEPELAQLLEDDAAVLLLPLPGILEELLAGEVFLADAHTFELGHDLALCRDGSVVGAGDPAGVLAVHTRLADEDVVEGIVEHVAHMKDAGDVRRRYHDGIRFPSVRFGVEKLVLEPIGIPLVFHLGSIVFSR